MKPKSFGNVIWSSLMSSSSGYAVFLSLIIGVVSWTSTPDSYTVAFKLLCIAIIFFAFLFLVALVAAWQLYVKLENDPRLTPPKVIHARKPSKAHPTGFALLLLNPTPIFSYQSLASIYYVEDGVEHFAALGKVVNIQQDEKIQVLLIKDCDIEDRLPDILKNSKDVLSKLIVKTSVPVFLFEGAE
ncbi:hypothetical protein [Halomonas sp. YLGW01]|uniref:hypothetical protein n=1 Tax=Halomonas sp. YLGW01 TaxID=2773308 RepID=UPI00177FE353|nr:hypothetical protein [Halomonas sp. YLGW01]